MPMVGADAPRKFRGVYTFQNNVTVNHRKLLLRAEGVEGGYTYSVLFGVVDIYHARSLVGARGDVGHQRLVGDGGRVGARTLQWGSDMADAAKPRRAPGSSISRCKMEGRMMHSEMRWE